MSRPSIFGGPPRQLGPTVTAAMATLDDDRWWSPAWARAWESVGTDSTLKIIPGGDTQCDPVRIEHGPGLSWTAYQGSRVIAKQASCISPTPWPKEHD